MAIVQLSGPQGAAGAGRAQKWPDEPGRRGLYDDCHAVLAALYTITGYGRPGSCQAPSSSFHWIRGLGSCQAPRVLDEERQAVLAALYTFTGGPGSCQKLRGSFYLIRGAWFLPGAKGLGRKASGGVGCLVHVHRIWGSWFLPGAKGLGRRGSGGVGLVLCSHELGFLGEGRQAVLAALYTFTGDEGLGQRASGGVGRLVHLEDTFWGCLVTRGAE